MFHKHTAVILAAALVFGGMAWQAAGAPPQPRNDEDLAALAGNEEIRVLHLWQSQVTDEGLRYAAEMPNLKSIALGYCDITDAGLEHLRNHPSLETVQLMDNFVTDKGMAALATIPNMRHLDITETKATDAGMAHVAKMRNLVSLRADQNHDLGDDGIVQLVGLEKLESLTIGNLSDRGLEAVGKLHALKRLHLGPCDVTDAGLASLANLPNLEELNIGGEGITDEGLRSIAEIKGLKVLWIQHSSVTDEGFAVLSGHPNMERLLLNGGNVSTGVLRYVCTMPKLTDLTLNEIGGNSDGLKHLAGKTNLTRLGLGFTWMDPAQLVHVEGMDKLEYLNVRFPMTNEGMTHLAGLHSLKQLTVYDFEGQSTVDDEGMTHLAGLTNLESLSVNGKFTDRGLEQLYGMNNLYYLNVGSRTVSADGLAELQRRLPRLKNVQNSARVQVGAMPTPGQQAPDIELTTLDGKTWKLADQRGKAVLLYFWATWCSPCVGSTPALKQWHDELKQIHGESFEMLSLSLDEQEYQPKRHAEFYKLDWPQAMLGQDSQVRISYGVEGVAAYFLIGPDGRIVSTSRSWDQLKAAVGECLVY